MWQPLRHPRRLYASEDPAVFRFGFECSFMVARGSDMSKIFGPIEFISMMVDCL